MILIMKINKIMIIIIIIAAEHPPSAAATLLTAHLRRLESLTLAT